MLFVNQQPPLHKVSTIDDSKIEEHNLNNPWKQGPNKIWEGTTLADAKKTVTSAFASHSNLVRCTVDDSVSTPESFDARTQWAKCKLPVQNQQSNKAFNIRYLWFKLRYCISNNSR
jgi:hypothetical protein